MQRERLYYLTDNIESVESITEDLKTIGVEYNHYHVLSRDDDGIKRHHLHSASPLDKYDIVHMGERGVLLGFIAGLVLALSLVISQPFDLSVGWIGFMSVLIFVTFFGAWVGGMAGLGSENYKISKFHDELEEGQYLVMIDTTIEHEAEVRELMEREHQEAHWGGIDKTATNPFDGLPILKSLQG